MTISPIQTFIIAMVLGGAYGARRGWAREVITTSVVLSDVLFLSNGGANFLANVISGGLGTPATGTALGGPLFAGGGVGGTAPAGSAASAAYGTSSLGVCSVALVTAVSRITFFGLSWIGYRSGSRFGPAPKIASHRVAGTVPGAINGAAIAYYVSNNVLPGTSVVLNTPGSVDTSQYLPMAFGIGIVALLIVLFVASQMKKAGGGH
jgi:hypothetical protein